MTFKEIQELLKQINKLELAEFKLKDGNFEMAVRTKHYTSTKGMKTMPVTAAPAYNQNIAPPVVNPASEPVAAQPAMAADAPEEKSDNGNYLEVKSPMVGTFYRASSPDKPPFVKVGDVINEGDVVCIVEAMKLFNEIESELSGKIVKVLVEDAQPIEYDQVLFLVDPNA